MISSLNKLKPRQRIILCLLILSSIYLGWDSYIYQVQLKNLIKDEKNLESIKNKVEDYRLNKIVKNQNENKKNLNSIKNLKNQVEKLEKEIKKANQNLINPKQMQEVLNTIVENKILKVIFLKKEKAVILNQENFNKKGEAPIYQHDVNIEFEGSYLSMLEYMKSIEESKFKIHWKSVKINSENYPKSKILISLYTLSLQEGWLGV